MFRSRRSKVEVLGKRKDHDPPNPLLVRPSVVAITKLKLYVLRFFFRTDKNDKDIYVKTNCIASRFIEGRL